MSPALLPQTVRCMLVDKPNGKIQRGIQDLPFEQLPPGEAVVAIEYSSLNYKDALAATGHPGVCKAFPMVPGIDAVGKVVACASARFQPGDAVLVANPRFGTEVWGGYATYARLPQEWLIPLPGGLSPREAMVIGTAGFTAAQCVEALIANGAKPEGGEIVVSGATGGVGILAVMLLAKMGFQVVASTGKTDREDWLKRLGASRVIDRKNLVDESQRPLLPGMWQGAVDTVGGNTLATILRATKNEGCVTACGLVGGNALSLTVYPFILRGVILHGIDSANISIEHKLKIWTSLAGPWRLSNLEEVSESVGLIKLNQKIDDILAGKIFGRTVVDLSLTS